MCSFNQIPIEEKLCLLYEKIDCHRRQATISIWSTKMYYSQRSLLLPMFHRLILDVAVYVLLSFQTKYEATIESYKKKLGEYITSFVCNYYNYECTIKLI